MNIHMVRIGRGLCCVLGMLIGGCDLIDLLAGLGPPVRLLYSNSFEAAKDTSGIVRSGSVTVVKEGAPGCGVQSIQVAGGCIIPHAAIRIAGPDKDAQVELRCWGKNLMAGGQVELRRASAPQQGLWISISAKEWAHRKSETRLFVPAGDSLDIWMNAGGIMASAMLVDRLEVVVAQ